MNDYKINNGDCEEVMASMESNSVDAIVTDPPYGLAFMGAKWDSFGGSTGNQTISERQSEGKRYAKENKGAPRYANSHGKKVTLDEMAAFQTAMTPIFSEALRVAKPGAHLLCFGGTRTYHRMTCAIEDAGWEIRDCIMWVYGSGFPKSMDVGKAIDKALGAKREIVGKSTSGASSGSVAMNHGRSESFGSADGDSRTFEITRPSTDQAKEWDGWGTCLKPAWEPIIVARKPLDGTVANNVMEHGTGAINIDGCRVENTDTPIRRDDASAGNTYKQKGSTNFAASTGAWRSGDPKGRFPANLVHDGSQEVSQLLGDAQRFFYCAKASKRDRGDGNDHPTVKPNDLMRWLVRLVCPKGGTVLDPFMGSGSTGVACIDEDMRFVGIEREVHYCEIADERINEAMSCNAQGTLFD